MTTLKILLHQEIIGQKGLTEGNIHGYQELDIRYEVYTLMLKLALKKKLYSLALLLSKNIDILNSTK